MVLDLFVLDEVFEHLDGSLLLAVVIVILVNGNFHLCKIVLDLLRILRVCAN